MVHSKINPILINIEVQLETESVLSYNDIETYTYKKTLNVYIQIQLNVL